MLTAYAKAEFVPTVKSVKLADGEKLCLAQAIYHEARGESREGQLAVANVIINRAFSKKYPSTICGVVFQNADKGNYKCQFTFACDGRSDMGTRAQRLEPLDEDGRGRVLRIPARRAPGRSPELGAVLPHDGSGAELVPHLPPRRRHRLARVLLAELRLSGPRMNGP